MIVKGEFETNGRQIYLKLVYQIVSFTKYY